MTPTPNRFPQKGVALCESLMQSPLVRDALAEFGRAAGLPVTLVPVPLPQRRTGTSVGERGFPHHTATASGELPTGMVQLAVPVAANGRHKSTVVAGKVLKDSAVTRYSGVVAQLLHEWEVQGEQTDLNAAYLRSPVLSEEELATAGRLLDDLARLFSKAAFRSPPCHSSFDPPLVSQAKRFVREHLAERITTRHVAECLRVSEAHFCRTFHHFTGMNFHGYLAKVRVEAAKTALLSTRQNITEVAFATGFQSTSDFDRVFKAHEGMSPLAYQRQHRKAVVARRA